MDTHMPRVLIVEDNQINRDALERRLRRASYSVRVALDGFEALAKVQEERPDVILMDIGLPEMDGLATTLRLKADPRTASIPVIALTAHAMPEDEGRARAAGCDDYDTKPIEFQRLLGKISTVLGTR